MLYESTWAHSLEHRHIHMNRFEHLLLAFVRVGDRRERVFALGDAVDANCVVDSVVLLVLREH